MKTVIEMAREARAIGFVHDAGEVPFKWLFTRKELEAFAELVRADERACVMNEPITKAHWQKFAYDIRADEREAMVAEAAKKGWGMRNDDPFEDCVREIAELRARGNT